MDRFTVETHEDRTGTDHATRSYVHLPQPELPSALHELHRSLAVGGTAEIVVLGDASRRATEGDERSGPNRSRWPEQLLVDIIDGAGFAIDERTVVRARDADPVCTVRVRRLRTLADTVGADMRLLVCGLNPSVYAADAGVGFARPGNRFWPAALAAAIVTQSHDPMHALKVDHVGMTDLVKRASPRADGLTNEEYASGLERVGRLSTWLQPAALCFVGLAGWRAAVDRKATAGPQSNTMGGRPVYVMPNTSGVNTRTPLAELTAHLRAAAALADEGFACPAPVS